MIRKRISLAVAGVLTAGTAITLGLAGPASAANAADPLFTPTAGDIVGVGSDTSQVALHNIAGGYNVGKSTGRLASWAADGTPATISLKGGAAITRPNGSGNGKKLLYGADNDTDVDFARSSSTLSSTEIAAGLFQAAFAVDGIKLAVSTNSNAPATITAADAVGIFEGTYSHWNELPGNAGGSTAEIHPFIPQDGSGTRTFFLAQLAATKGAALNSLVGGTTQEHSDVDIKNDPNAIAPFSTGRAKSTTTIKLLGGLSYNRALYNVLRTADLNKPYVSSLFAEAGYLCSPAAKPLIESAGFEQLASVDDGGVCGELTQATVTNFTTSNTVVIPPVVKGSSSIALSVAGSTYGKAGAKITATVKGGSAAGTVGIKVGAEPVRTVALSGGKATVALPAKQAAGTVPVIATWGGDATTKGSSATGSLKIVKASSTAKLKIADTSIKTSQKGKATVTLKVAGAAKGIYATGKVTLKVGKKTVGTGTLSKGKVKITLKKLGKGTHKVKAVYAGSKNVKGSTSKTVKLKVKK